MIFRDCNILQLRHANYFIGLQNPFLEVQNISPKSFPENSWFFFSKMVKNVSKSVWVQARELKFYMNMLCFFKYEVVYSNLEFFEIRSSGFLKTFDYFLKKCQKCVVELKFCMNELFLLFEISRSSLWITMKKIC
jgi:hypothetical protein